MRSSPDAAPYRRRRAVSPGARGRLGGQGTAESVLFRLAIETMAQGLFMLDANQRIIVVNRQFLEIYGLSGDIIKVGATARDIVEQSVLAGNYPGLTVEAAWVRATSRLAARLPWRLQQRLGNGRVVQIAYAPVQDGGWVTTHLDVTERQNAEDRLAYLARHDALTGLLNRPHLLEVLGQHLERRAAVAVLCLDLDRFKPVNDMLGHASGDALLCQVAARLQACVREGDTVARFGGDEFAVVLASKACGRQARQVAARIVAGLGAPFALGDHRVQIGVSVGMVVDARGEGDAKTLLKHADTALYRAKSEGRNTFRVFEPEMDTRLEDRRVLELSLREAVERETFELHYQPMVDLATGAVTQFEALLRWRDPERGLVAPNDFVPLAEETGLIVPIGAWVLRTACAEAAGWPPGIGVSVNLSALQLGREGFAAGVEAALDASGLPAHRLQLEITESVLMQDRASSTAALATFRRMGITLALDDFGTGHSSLSYLRRFPFDKIKIDRSFVQDMTELEEARAIVGAVVALGRSLGMHVLAEGVETRAQLDMLRAMGCQSVQGFLVGRPVPASMALAAARRHFVQNAGPDQPAPPRPKTRQSRDPG